MAKVRGPVPPRKRGRPAALVAAVVLATLATAALVGAWAWSATAAAWSDDAYVLGLAGWVAAILAPLPAFLAGWGVRRPPLWHVALAAACWWAMFLLGGLLFMGWELIIETNLGGGRRGGFAAAFAAVAVAAIVALAVAAGSSGGKEAK